MYLSRCIIGARKYHRCCLTQSIQCVTGSLLQLQHGSHVFVAIALRFYRRYVFRNHFGAILSHQQASNRLFPSLRVHCIGTVVKLIHLCL